MESNDGSISKSGESVDRAIKYIRKSFPTLEQACLYVAGAAYACGNASGSPHLMQSPGETGDRPPPYAMFVGAFDAQKSGDPSETFIIVENALREIFGDRLGAPEVQHFRRFI